MTESEIRVRFCPSPTGNPHVGLVRTALFNWAYARNTGATFVFRIEDTDAARDSEDSYQALIESLKWLGLDWDEGPEVGGGYGPYRQSERGEIYRRVAGQLLSEGYAYRCFCSAPELEKRRELAVAEKRAPGYDGACRDLSSQQVSDFENEGRDSVLRFRMPDSDVSWVDLIRGEVSFGAEHVPDFVLVRANGDPLYTLVNPVDDALMNITHVLRGEDLLSSTPRQLALFEALKKIGVATLTPQYGHLPYVMGEGNKKLSKRDPESALSWYRENGFLPEGLLNYLALLGWSMGNDVEFFSMQEMAEAFSLERVNPNPARFDLKKCTAINADWIRHIEVEDLTERLIPFLASDNLISESPTESEREILNKVVPLIQERIEKLTDATELVRFLFVPAESIEIDNQLWTEGSLEVLQHASLSLAELRSWETAQIESTLRRRLVEEQQLKPRLAFGPIRTAISGRKVSPPLFESMEILGKSETLNRMNRAIENLVSKNPGK